MNHATPSMKTNVTRTIKIMLNMNSIKLKSEVKSHFLD
jgi:hypothetical protein